MKKVFLISLIALFVFTGVEEVQAMSPDEFIEEKIAEVLAILGDTDPVDAIQADTVQQRLIETLEADFDFEEMTLRTLGPYARQITDEQLDEMIDLFSELLKEVYVNRITGDLADVDGVYEIRAIDVDGFEERRDGTYARVFTTARLYWDDDDYNAKITYYLIKHDDWKIYDFEVEGISLIRNYRRQFDNILARQSIADLLKLLREHIQKEELPDEIVPEFE